jgi:hypothetical protein
MPLLTCNHVKLPPDTTIAREKLTGYLLVRQTRGDKSTFLNRAGYTVANADRLLRDLRKQLLSLDAEPLNSTQFGQFYEIRGTLSGPNGVTLSVRSIWMKEHLSGTAKFITLIPDQT